MSVQGGVWLAVAGLALGTIGTGPSTSREQGVSIVQ